MADCPLCTLRAAADPLHLCDLPSGRVRLIDDAGLRGYCVLVHRRHVTELFELDPAERREWVEDVARLASAIAARFGPLKINYEILGNEVPHLHTHVIPRYADDAWRGKAIWVRPREAIRTLAPEQYGAIREALRSALASADPKPAAGAPENPL